MPYPDELLPQKDFFSEINTEDLIDQHPALHLLRKVYRDADDLSPLKIREILPKNIDFYECSTYSFGNFTLAHIPFNPDDEEMPWKKGDDCLPANAVQYKIEANSVIPVFIVVLSIHNRKFPITKAFGNPAQHTIQATILVRHKPVQFNYWHFEFEVRDENDLVITRDKANKKDFLKSAAHDFAEIHLKHLFTKTHPEPVLISQPLYR